MENTCDIIDKHEAAKEIRGCTKTVERYRKRAVDPLPFIQFSKRRIAFSRTAIRAWIARRTVGEVSR